MEQIFKIINSGFSTEGLTNWVPFLILAVFIFSILEVVFPVIPGGLTTLIASGTLAGIYRFSPIGIILAAATGTALGSLIIYLLGYKLEKAIFNSPRYSRSLDTKTFIKIEGWFQRYGFWLLLISRFLLMFRACIALTAGILRYPRHPTAIALGSSIIAASSFYVLLGYSLGESWKTTLQSWLNQPIVYLCLLIFLLILFAYGWFRRQFKKQEHS